MMSIKPKSLREYVDSLQSGGRYTFSKAEAMKTLKTSDMTFDQASARLVKKRRIVTPRRGFFVTVPVEYLTSGAPPATWFIHDLMAFHKKPYYVGLLTAAALHGAAHQQPQEFQVVTTKPLRPIKVGRARIRFFMKKHLEKTATMRVNTYTGSLTLSTPEATAMDLVRYIDSVGYLGNAATVLTELGEKLSAEKLLSAAEADTELSVVQRVGYLLDHLGWKKLTGKINTWCLKQDPPYIPLSPGQPRAGFPRDPKWRVIENEEVESDI